MLPQLGAGTAAIDADYQAEIAGSPCFDTSQGIFDDNGSLGRNPGASRNRAGPDSADRSAP